MTTPTLADKYPGWPDVTPEEIDPVDATALAFCLELRRVVDVYVEKRWATSLHDFADRIDIPQATLHRIINGKSWPAGHTVAHLEWALNRKLWPSQTQRRIQDKKAPGYRYP